MQVFFLIITIHPQFYYPWSSEQPSQLLCALPPSSGSSFMPSGLRWLFTHAPCPQWLSIRALLLLTTSSQLSAPLSVGRFPAFGTSVAMTVASTFISHMVFYKTVCVCQLFPAMFVWCLYCSLMSAYTFMSCITLIIQTQTYALLNNSQCLPSCYHSHSQLVPPSQSLLTPAALLWLRAHPLPWGPPFPASDTRHFSIIFILL